MKTKLLLSTFLVAISLHQVFANHLNSVVNLRMFNGSTIAVQVDGRQAGPAASAIRMAHLAPGTHWLKVEVIERPLNGWHTVKRLVYSGQLNVIEGYEINAFIDPHHYLVIESTTALIRPRPNHGFPGYGPTPVGWPGVQGQPGPSCGTQPIEPHGHGAYLPRPISPADFNQLRSVIASKWFESTKQTIALQALNSNYFTSQQIRQLLGLFTFESTKVDIAKAAYGRVIDPEMYYVVYDAFTFESSINQLQASLR